MTTSDGHPIPADEMLASMPDERLALGIEDITRDIEDHEFILGRLREMRDWLEAERQRRAG